MARWCGKVGYAETVETVPGRWEEVFIERLYFGDEYKSNRMIQTSQSGTNDNVNISNQISFVADPYANDHIYAIRYAEFQGAKWRVSNVDVQRPRLVLSLGGLWNG